MRVLDMRTACLLMRMMLHKLEWGHIPSRASQPTHWVYWVLATMYSLDRSAQQQHGRGWA